MSKKVSILLVSFIITAMCLPVLTISAWQKTQQKIVKERAFLAAYHRLTTSPTFVFDGLIESVQFKSVQRKGNCFIVCLDFECSHNGYGDRQEQVLLQVVTRHVAEAHVISGCVVGMVLDGIWDELGQTFIKG